MEYITVSGEKAMALMATMIPSTMSRTIPRGRGVYLLRICVIIPVPPVEEQTEERLYSKGRVGDIFALKAVHGWEEEQSPHTVNQTLVIATEEQAREAIKMLK